MNRALAYGLMGAAHGVLQGLYGEWQQNQQDIRNAALLKAKMQEQQQLARMTAQYNSAANLQKMTLQFQADSALQKQKSADAASLAAQKDTADASLQSAKDKAAMSRAQVGAGATLGAAQIRSADNDQVKPRLVAVKDKAGNITFRTAQPGDSLPAGASLTSLSGDPDFSQLPIGMLGNFGAPTSAAPAPGNAAAPPKTVGNPGASAVQGASDPTQGATPYPDGTRLMGPGGKPYVVRNGTPVPVGS